MTNNEKKKKRDSDLKNNQDGCPKKEGDNCLVPGVYSDSEPIGGS